MAMLVRKEGKLINDNPLSRLDTSPTIGEIKPTLPMFVKRSLPAATPDREGSSKVITTIYKPWISAIWVRGPTTQDLKEVRKLTFINHLYHLEGEQPDP